MKLSDSRAGRAWFLLLLSLVVAAAALGGYLLVSRQDPREHRARAFSCADDTFGCVEVPKAASIKIGTLLLHEAEIDSQNGAVLAIEFRDTPGEIAGHSVEFVHQDDGCSPEGGRSGAEALAAEPRIAGVIGTSCSSSALGVADRILGQKGILLISPSNTGPAVTAPANHQPFYLRTSHNDKLQAVAMATFAFEEAGWRTASTIHDGSAYAVSLQNVFADTFESLGGTVVRQQTIEPGDIDFSRGLRDLAADDIDGLYFPIFVPDSGLFTAQARALDGLAETDLSGPDALFSRDWIHAAGPKNAEGVYVSAPDLASFTESEFYKDEFVPAYRERFQFVPRSPFHAYAFDAVNLLADAIEDVAIRRKDGGLHIPRTRLRDRVFATTGYKGITGVLTCDENGDCRQEANMLIYRVKNGRFGEPIKRYTVSLEEPLG